VGARIDADEYEKEEPRDFVLWKAPKQTEEPRWAAPFGEGRPGWHIECSAMAMKYLGETLDLHCGGIDLVFPHHEDEIAQSEAATGREFSRVWCHGEFLLTDGAKMAKRVGNVSTVADLREENVSAAALRHFVFTTHYRKQLNLSSEALEQSRNAVERIGTFAERLRRARGGTPALAEAARVAEQDAVRAFFDDLNAPEALGALGTFITRANAELDRGGTDQAALAEARRVFAVIDGVLDVVPSFAVDDDALRAYVEERIAARAEARARRDFAAADAIRQELLARGIAIEDGSGGTRWRKTR
jgi:cysteinyl-tRNA synthetase